MAEVLWLKKKADIDIDGDYDYTANCYLLDTNVKTIDFDTPSKKIDVRKKIGNGQYVRVTDYYDSRNIKMTLTFKKDSSGNNVFNDDRLSILKNWLTIDTELYLVRKYMSRTEKIRVYPVGIGGEKYNNYISSDTITIEFLTDSPFFDDVTQTTNAFASTGGDKVCSVTNDGVKVPFVITIDLVADTDGIIIKLYENIQLQLTEYFYSGDIIIINMATMGNTLNGSSYDFVTVGSPFQLETGTNSVTVNTNGACDIDIDYYERYL